MIRFGITVTGRISDWILCGALQDGRFKAKAVDSFNPTEICYEKGNVIIDQIHIARKVSFIPHGAPASGKGKAPEAEVIAEGLPKDEYFYEFEEFINTIENGLAGSSVNSLQTSLLNARLMDAIKPH